MKVVTDAFPKLPAVPSLPFAPTFYLANSFLMLVLLKDVVLLEDVDSPKRGKELVRNLMPRPSAP